MRTSRHCISKSFHYVAIETEMKIISVTVFYIPIKFVIGMSIVHNRKTLNVLIFNFLRRCFRKQYQEGQIKKNNIIWKGVIIMLHPSYSDLMKVVNSEVEPGEAPVVNSRYSIVMATAKRARQIIAGEDPLVNEKDAKPLSVAVEELNQGKIKILSEEE